MSTGRRLSLCGQCIVGGCYRPTPSQPPSWQSDSYCSAALTSKQDASQSLVLNCAIECWSLIVAHWQAQGFSNVMQPYYIRPYDKFFVWPVKMSDQNEIWPDIYTKCPDTNNSFGPMYLCCNRYVCWQWYSDMHTIPLVQCGCTCCIDWTENCPDNQVNGRTYWLFVRKMSDVRPLS